MSKSLMVGVIGIAALMSTSQAEGVVVYHELFGNTNLDGSLSKLGWHYQLDYSTPHTKYSETGTDPWGNSYNGWDIGGPGASGGPDQDGGSVNSNPLKPDSNSNGYSYLPLGAANASLLYTNEYVIDQTQWKDLKISFYHEDDATGTTFRVLVGVAATPSGTPTWYVSDASSTITSTGFSTSNNVGRLYIDTTGSSWNTITANYLVDASVGNLPAGYIVAFGLQTQNSVTTNRFDNFMVEANAIPEPASAALAGLAGLACLARRRKV